MRKLGSYDSAALSRLRIILYAYIAENKIS
jgi:hypothetical protein